jgi:hypothetical protein
VPNEVEKLWLFLLVRNVIALISSSDPSDPHESSPSSNPNVGDSSDLNFTANGKEFFLSLMILKDCYIFKRL